ncbi:MAG: CelD-like protein, partial [Pseudomonadota bacterium]|nr:CelD-like protein [Pseudomonadota bacterium]
KDRYKQSLATCEERLEWWVVERFSPRLELEALLRRLLRRPASA